jgi:alanine dehydrogenase
LTPESVAILTNGGHQVMVLAKAGLGIGKTDQDYLSAGAEIVATRDEIFERAEMISKSKRAATGRVCLAKIRSNIVYLSPSSTRS